MLCVLTATYITWKLNYLTKFPFVWWHSLSGFYVHNAGKEPWFYEWSGPAVCTHCWCCEFPFRPKEASIISVLAGSRRGAPVYYSNSDVIVTVSILMKLAVTVVVRKLFLSSKFWNHAFSLLSEAYVASTHLCKIQSMWRPVNKAK